MKKSHVSVNLALLFLFFIHSFNLFSFNLSGDTNWMLYQSHASSPAASVCCISWIFVVSCASTHCSTSNWERLQNKKCFTRIYFLYNYSHCHLRRWWTIILFRLSYHMSLCCAAAVTVSPCLSSWGQLIDPFSVYLCYLHCRFLCLSPFQVFREGEERLNFFHILNGSLEASIQLASSSPEVRQ